MNWANVKNLKFQIFFFFSQKKWENREKLDIISRKLDFLKLRKFKKIGKTGKFDIAILFLDELS